MEALKNVQLKEAQKLQADGRALLKTNLLRWKPDYENAVLKLDKAATLFKGMGRADEAYIAYREAGQAHIGNKSEYFAAKAFEAAAGLMRDKKQYEKAADDFEKAADLYHSDGKPDRAAEVYIKAAKMLEELDGFNERTKKLYASAVDVIEEPHLQADPYRAYVNFLVKKQLYDDAIGVLKKMTKLFSDIKQEHNLYKCYLGIVVLFLEMDDWPAADDYHTLAKQKSPEYFETEEAYTAQNLLDAFENNDEKRLEEIIKTSGRLKYLEGQLIQVAKRLKIKAFSKPGASATTTTSAPKKKPNKNEDKKRAALFSGAEEEEEEEENPEEEEELTKVETPSKAKPQASQSTGEPPKPKSEKSFDDYLNYALGDEEDNAENKEDIPEEEEPDAFDPNNLT